MNAILRLLAPFRPHRPSADGTAPKPPLRRSVLWRVVIYSLLFFFALPIAFCRIMTQTYPRPVAPPPPSVEEIALQTKDVRLRAWVLNGAGSRAPVLIAHGLGDSLESYLDIGQVFARRGHPVLLLDMRGHGGSSGRVGTMGAHEREDVRAGLDEIARRWHARSIAIGFSMGAVAVLRAAADRADIRAVIAEAPYDTYRETITHHAQIFYHLPRWTPLIPMAIRYAEWWGGFDADEVNAVDAARRIRAPLFLMADGGDPRMPASVVRRIYDAHTGSKRFWGVPDAPHLGASLHAEFWPRIETFLTDNGL